MNFAHSKLLHPKYRSDIDGLRAVAVLSVVIYHASNALLPGGFIGVDIFFVISGFLISTILFENLERDTFSFTVFYARRIKRIFPALIIVLLAVYAFGWFALLSEEYMQLGKHMAAGAGFVSNLVLWSEVGYFDNLSETKPLLHLWSLGVEEQFYVIWPLIIWLLWLLWKRSTGLLLVVISISLFSFLLNLNATHNNAVAAFYSPQSRFWELLTGSVLAWLSLYRPNTSVAFHRPTEKTIFSARCPRSEQVSKIAVNLTSLTGVALIFFGVTYVHRYFRFPGAWAVFPVLGAALLIFAGPRAWFNRVVLSNRIVVWFGLISFPLYLWHWPLLSFARVVESETPDKKLRMGAVALAIILAWLTYRLIERPIRRGTSSVGKIGLLVGCMVVIGCMGFLTYRYDGFPFRVHATLKDLEGDIGHYAFHKYVSDMSYVCTPDSIASEAGTWEGFLRCRQSKSKRDIDIALIGDSHAEHLFIGLAEALPDKNVVYYARGSLALLYNNDFARIFDEVISNKSIHTVIYTMAWQGRKAELPPGLNFEQELAKTLDALIAAGKKVYVVDDVPEFPFRPERCQGRRWLESRPTICEMSAEADNKDYREYVTSLEHVVASRPEAKFLSVHQYFCDDRQCRMTNGKELLYRDTNHLNINGSRLAGRRLVADNPDLAMMNSFER